MRMHHDILFLPRGIASEIRDIRLQKQRQHLRIPPKSWASPSQWTMRSGSKCLTKHCQSQIPWWKTHSLSWLGLYTPISSNKKSRTKVHFGPKAPLTYCKLCRRKRQGCCSASGHWSDAGQNAGKISGKCLENDVPWIDLRNLLQETIGFYL